MYCRYTIRTSTALTRMKAGNRQPARYVSGQPFIIRTQDGVAQRRRRLGAANQIHIVFRLHTRQRQRERKAYCPPPPFDVMACEIASELTTAPAARCCCPPVCACSARLTIGVICNLQIYYVAVTAQSLCCMWHSTHSLRLANSCFINNMLQCSFPFRHLCRPRSDEMCINYHWRFAKRFMYMMVEVFEHVRNANNRFANAANSDTRAESNSLKFQFAPHQVCPTRHK